MQQIISSVHFVYEKLNDPANAFKDLSQAINLDSTNLQYYHAIAEVYLKGGSADRAIKTYNRIIQLNPKDTNAYMKLSKVYFYDKDYKSSMKTLQQLQNMDPNNVEVWFVRGLNLKESRRHGRCHLCLPACRSNEKQFL